MAKKDEATFEKDLESLEAIVAALEAGGLTLDEALKQFENGIGLARRCETALAGAEKKIEVLMKNAAGELEAEPFDEHNPPEPPTSAPAATASVKQASPLKQAGPHPPARAVVDSDEPEPEPEPDDEDLLF